MFINLEGAGAGGRAALFRSTSPRLTAAFSAAAHPHGSVLFSDIFASGAVRSITDFQIYDAAGMTGVDYAFYTGRHKYHTVYDSIPSLRGNKALWGMMENVHGAAVSVAHDTRPEDDESLKVVYFDSKCNFVHRPINDKPLSLR
jgi:Zn-dependent M28 family amino/carboxypeptidase